MSVLINDRLLLLIQSLKFFLIDTLKLILLSVFISVGQTNHFELNFLYLTMYVFEFNDFFVFSLQQFVEIFILLG